MTWGWHEEGRESGDSWRGTEVLVGKEGVVASQGPNRIKRACPKWDNLGRVYLQRRGQWGTRKNGAENLAQ